MPLSPNYEPQGTVAPEFEEVRNEFRKNLQERGELGGACALYVQGKNLVDLWGGIRDPRKQAPWEKDTLVTVFSTTKGLAAMALAAAHSRGLFELDEPVATYWPEFTQAGKARITVRQLLAHQAGLCAVNERIDVAILSDLDALGSIIAKQAPAWTPGERHGYHGLTLGMYENEFIRRVDPGHRSLGRFFAEEIARPLGVDFYIGLRASVSHDRVASIKDFHPVRMLMHFNSMPLGMLLSLMSPWSLTYRSLMNPRMRRPAEMAGPKYRSIEFPSGGGIGNARSIARAYSAFATGGKELGLTAKTMQELTSPARAPTRGSFDAVLKIDTSFSLGFWKPCTSFLPGMSSTVFGGHGAGGSVGFADSDRGVAYSYVTNKLGFRMFDDPREKALRDACYRSLEKVMSSPADRTLFTGGTDKDMSKRNV
jgi:CubicO group peptidase (beta-lactamase class C family)